MTLVLLFIVLLGAGVLTFGGMILLTAWSILHPPRMTDGKALHLLNRLTPRDLNLNYDNVTFEIRSERANELIRIAGWRIDAKQASDRTVILVHGYADAKVGAIAWAPVWHDLGFNILAIDLRAHGDTRGAGRVTGGVEESGDLNSVIDQLPDRFGAKVKHLFVFGISYGAAVTVAAAAKRRAGELTGVVLESPYADFRSAVTAQLRFLGFGGPVLQKLAIKLAQAMTRVDYASVRPVDLLLKVSCPVLCIAPADDPFIRPDESAVLESALNARNNPADVLWRPANAGHLTALHNDPVQYREQLQRFTTQSLLALDDGARKEYDAAF